jgi:hypothetical protein
MEKQQIIQTIEENLIMIDGLLRQTGKELQRLKKMEE